jgi:RND family efflux transporter MFP subunit
LGTLDAADFELRLQLARARREQAKIALDTAKKDFAREQQLQKENASTSATLEKVQATFDQARLQLRLAELDETISERALNDTKLKAPYDCVVTAQLKFEGESVNTNTSSPAYEVVDVSAPEITFEVPERLISKVAVGDSLAVQIPSTGFSGKAKIVRMVPVIAQSTRSFQIIASPQGHATEVVPGSFAEATLD